MIDLKKIKIGQTVTSKYGMGPWGSGRDTWLTPQDGGWSAGSFHAYIRDVEKTAQNLKDLGNEIEQKAKELKKEGRDYFLNHASIMGKDFLSIDILIPYTKAEKEIIKKHKKYVYLDKAEEKEYNKTGELPKKN